VRTARRRTSRQANRPSRPRSRGPVPSADKINGGLRPPGIHATDRHRQKVAARTPLSTGRPEMQADHRDTGRYRQQPGPNHLVDPPPVSAFRGVGYRPNGQG
jgi:hypothetical protein